MARKSKGRQKVEMTKMTKESNLLVTFSKRRVGLFKKASELSTLCGVEIAIVVFSPGLGKKVYSFGSPYVERVIDRFFNSLNSISENDSHVFHPMGLRIQELNRQLTELLDQLEGRKIYGEGLANELKQSQALDWRRAHVRHLGLEQLQSLESRFGELKTSVANQVRNHAIMKPQVKISASSSSGVKEDADGSIVAFGITLTPQGYAFVGDDQDGLL